MIGQNKHEQKKNAIGFKHRDWLRQTLLYGTKMIGCKNTRRKPETPSTQHVCTPWQEYRDDNLHKSKNVSVEKPTAVRQSKAKLLLISTVFSLRRQLKKKLFTSFYYSFLQKTSKPHFLSSRFNLIILTLSLYLKQSS